MMGLPDGPKSFKIGLVVLIEYQLWQTATQPATQPCCRSYFSAYVQGKTKPAAQKLMDWVKCGSAWSIDNTNPNHNVTQHIRTILSHFVSPAAFKVQLARWFSEFSLPVFLLLGAKVPSGNFCSQELKFPGTFAPGSESSQEHSFHGW